MSKYKNAVELIKRRRSLYNKVLAKKPMLERDGISPETRARYHANLRNLKNWVIEAEHDFKIKYPNRLLDMDV